MKDNNWLGDYNDNIVDSVDEAIASLMLNPDDFEHDMELTGEVIDFIESLLRERETPVCYPWVDENENICYSTAERCKNCKKPKVVFEHDSFAILQFTEQTSADKVFSLLHNGTFVRRSNSLQDLKNQILGEDPTTFYSAR